MAAAANPALEQYRYEIRMALEMDLSVLIRRNEQVWEFTLGRFETDLKEFNTLIAVPNKC